MMRCCVCKIATFLYIVCSVHSTINPPRYSLAQPKSKSHEVLDNSRKNQIRCSVPSSCTFIPRGGNFDDTDDDHYDSEYDSEDAEEEPLSKSALKAATKARAKRVASNKKSVNASLVAQSNPKQSKTSSTKSLSRRVPYVIKAFLNPLTVFAMTRAYFASLFNINYLEDDTSQTLRSALQEKAQRSPGGSRKGGKGRKMRPGQAKTLSDLPQLSA
mmetsp:Transcript_21096/g.29559  ORF Transcript_21096/g.29559 Transcript_21096/m.29559 type:complete len:215 (+) Transcript_21096:166-810(+)|eukprot:CAMPEP_0184862960 /NCGR_PEP_ID=MMETSP0580-20130426/8173_1 /TAXON_ID=1118495 /ORGANISM="Dactyliosolen fragilissimus" /LENGTH=214 /DNA_ID=CAMNT_0027360987 /DNA_START=126 /DNA_END=770 /DNA_ORIENTATION=+